MDVRPVINETWKKALEAEFTSSYFSQLKAFLVEERARYQVYPPGREIFAAFDHTPLDKVKAVILGQDPYHGPGQAHGLCFSVPRGIQRPPSLVNIIKEISDDLGMPAGTGGDLSSWAKQGVLLLNATLTVRQHQAGSHQGKGWEQFTDSVIHKVSEYRDHVVFFLWGRSARDKRTLIDQTRHLVLEAPHPSPLSAYHGFFGCKHFSKANDYIFEHHGTRIDWSVG